MLSDEEKRERHEARLAFSRALSARLVHRQPCQVRGAKERVQAHHHRGYAPEHALDVEWLCTRHHGRAHVMNRQRGLEPPISRAPTESDGPLPPEFQPHQDAATRVILRWAAGQQPLS